MTQERAAALVDELFETWYAPLVRYARRLTGQQPSAEEIVQDTFLDLYKALRTGQDVRHPKAWTMTVVRHKVFDRRQEPFGLDQIHESLDDHLEATGDWPAPLHEAIDYQRVRNFALLSLREEEVLLLRLESMKYREIASALGISINSVNTLLARALDKMQRAHGADRARPGKAGDA